MLKIAIIIGSTRPGRNGEAVAKWVYEVAQKRSDAEFELVDIKDFDLPLLDEPMPPVMGQYSKPHTKVWAAKIDSFDGYVFVTPEYNHGTSGALKNAIDFLFCRVEQQGGWLRQLRWRQWSACRRAAASQPGGGANGHRASPSLVLHVHRLRKLQRLQARFTKRDVGQRDARSTRRMGRRAEDAPGENSIEDHRCKLA
jgi:NAD(P)H-dependent FMN reductase